MEIRDRLIVEAAAAAKKTAAARLTDFDFGFTFELIEEILEAEAEVVGSILGLLKTDDHPSESSKSSKSP